MIRLQARVPPHSRVTRCLSEGTPTGVHNGCNQAKPLSITNTISISWHLIFDISPISELPTGHQTFSWYAKGMRQVWPPRPPAGRADPPRESWRHGDQSKTIVLVEFGGPWAPKYMKNKSIFYDFGGLWISKSIKTGSF